jgi:hypothetical protein
MRRIQRAQKKGWNGRFPAIVRQPSIRNIVQLYKKPSCLTKTKTLLKKKRTLLLNTLNYSACPLFCKHYFENFSFFFHSRAICPKVLLGR